MSFSVSGLSSLAQIFTLNPNEVKALVKLENIQVLQSLGNGKYTILLHNKTLIAQSEKSLQEGVQYWTQIHYSKDTKPSLSNLIKIPLLLHTLKTSIMPYNIAELQSILSSRQPFFSLQQNLLEKLNLSSTKEEFFNVSNLLLSLHNQVFTIPISYENYFSVLQFKKRYNNKSKKTFLDFYAALEVLGPISGLITLEDAEIYVSLHVAFEKTKQFLEQDMKNFSHTVSITIQEDILPLYEITTQSLLDVSI